MKSINFLYHSTILQNFVNILNDKSLNPKKGLSIAGYNETEISLSDTLSDYLFIIFGNIVIEFKSFNIFKNNKLKPTIYSCSDIDFNDMPFEECEWKSKKIEFYLNDINKILYLPKTLTEYLQVKEICKVYNLKLQIIKSKKDLPSYPLEFFKDKYFNRINNAY